MTGSEIRQTMISAREEYIGIIKDELLGPGSEFSLPDREHDVCRFEFLSAFEILAVDFSPEFRYAVLALSVSFLHC